MDTRLHLLPHPQKQKYHFTAFAYKDASLKIGSLQRRGLPRAAEIAAGHPQRGNEAKSVGQRHCGHQAVHAPDCLLYTSRCV